MAWRVIENLTAGLRCAGNYVKNFFSLSENMQFYRYAVVRMVIFNYVLMALCLSEAPTWWYPSYGIRPQDRWTFKVYEPILYDDNINISCRIFTVLANALSLVPTFFADGTLKEVLLVAIVWNSFICSSVQTNFLGTLFVLYKVETPFYAYVELILTDIFLLAIHVQLIIACLLYYDYLNFVNIFRVGSKRKAAKEGSKTEDGKPNEDGNPWDELKDLLSAELFGDTIENMETMAAETAAGEGGVPGTDAATEGPGEATAGPEAAEEGPEAATEGTDAAKEESEKAMEGSEAATQGSEAATEGPEAASQEGDN